MTATAAPLVIGVLDPGVPGASLSELVAAAQSVVTAGADMVDLDLAPGGALAGLPAETSRALFAALKDRGVPFSVCLLDADLAAAASRAGAALITDPSGGTADPHLLPALAGGDTTVALGPWRSEEEDCETAPGWEDEYASGIVRRIAAALDAGVNSQRTRVLAGAGLYPEDPERWRGLNELDRLSALGYPLVLDLAAAVIGSVVVDEADEQSVHSAAIALTVLGAGVGVWAIRCAEVTVIRQALTTIARSSGYTGVPGAGHST